MAEINTQQMAQLLMGVARAQLAIIDSIENSKAGFKSTHLRPILESASRIRSNHPVALTDFPSRLLLQMLGRNPPDVDRVAIELEQLVGGGSGIPGRDSLDMT
jgi:hypothetical protein